jgi:hypothetical protein
MTGRWNDDAIAMQLNLLGWRRVQREDDDRTPRIPGLSEV